MIFQKLQNKLIGREGGEIICIEPFGKDCLRFRGTNGKEILEENWTLLPQPEVPAEIAIEPHRALIRNGKIQAEVRSDGSIKYLDKDGNMLLEELFLFLIYHQQHQLLSLLSSFSIFLKA